MVSDAAAISSPSIWLVVAITSLRPHPSGCLVHDDLEGHGPLAVAGTAAVDDVLGPGTALNVQHLALGRRIELHGDQGTQIAGLVQIRVVVGRESLAGVVLDVLETLLVLAQVSVAAHPDLFALQMANRELGM